MDLPKSPQQVLALGRREIGGDLLVHAQAARLDRLPQCAACVGEPVTGATGNIGRELVREFDERGVMVRALVREPARAVALPARVELVVADLGAPDTLQAAFDGVDRLFLLTQGIDTVFTSHALAAATAAGVRHVVAISSAYVRHEPMLAPRPRATHPGLGHPVDRPAARRLREQRPRLGVHHPRWRIRARPRRPRPERADRSGRHRRRRRARPDRGRVRGPGIHPHRQRAPHRRGAGPDPRRSDRRDIETRAPAGQAEAVAFRFPAGAPAALADAFTEGLVRMRADTVGFRTDTVERLLGRPPRTFADWCARHTDAFLPSDGRVTTTATARR